MIVSKIKAVFCTFFIILTPIIPFSAFAADCATLPPQVAIHHGFDWQPSSQRALKDALTFNCEQDISTSDIADVIQDFFVKSDINVDGIELFSLSENTNKQNNNNVLNFLVSSPKDQAETKAVILPLTLINRPISDFVNFATLNGEPKAGEELVLRFAVEAQIASQFSARPYVRWKRDGVTIPDINAARYSLTTEDEGSVISAELRLENAKGVILSVAEYAAEGVVTVEKILPSIIGLQLNGKPEEGQSLTVIYDVDQGQGYKGDVDYSIAWFRDDEPITSEQSSRYSLTSADIDKMISVEVTPVIGDAVRGNSNRATLTSPIQAKPMPKGQKAPSLSMADVNVDPSPKTSSGNAPSNTLTIANVVKDLNKAIVETATNSTKSDDGDTTAEENVIAAPPPKPINLGKTENDPDAHADASPTPLPDQLAALEDKITAKDGLNVKPEPEKVIPKGPMVKDLPKDLNGDRSPMDCFRLEAVDLESSTIIDNQTRDVLMSSFIDKCTTPALIGQVMETLNNFYIDEGYVTTRAYVAPQDLRDGDLDIVIVEGRIERFQFDNTTAITQIRLDLAFPVDPGDILNINSLERGLDQMNTPASNKVTMNMIPGTKPGFSIIDLQEEKIGPETRIKVGLDNMGSQGTGEDRLTLGLDVDNILGVNDTWSISHIGSLDTNAVAVNVVVPSGDWTFNSSYSYSDYLNYIDEATQLFGKSETIEVKADKLVYKADGNELSFKSSLNKKTSKRTIGDISLKSQTMNVGRIGFGFSRKSEAVFSGNVYLARGLKFFGAESDGQNVPQGTPRNQFTKIQFDGSYYRPVFKQIYLQSALAGQISSMSLFGSEQISAGGKSSVRGFARNSIAGDAGFYIQNDFLFPMPEIITWGPLREYVAAIKPFAGIDFAYTSDRSTYSRNAIAGLGLGAKFAKGNLSGDFGLGIPIYRKDGSRGNRVEKYVKILYEALEF